MGGACLGEGTVTEGYMGDTPAAEARERVNNTLRGKKINRNVVGHVNLIKLYHTPPATPQRKHDHAWDNKTATGHWQLAMRGRIFDVLSRYGLSDWRRGIGGGDAPSRVSNDQRGSRCGD